MPTNIVVTGIPDNVNFGQILNKFRAFFRKIELRNFWIREATESEGFQQVVVEFMNMADAKNARNFLNSQCLRHQKIDYPLVVHFENEASHFEKQEFNRGPRAAKRNRPRSRSPGYTSEASKLDMEIELLRKQRQVIEEERRLLVEQKKLEMIREFGPSAAREFDRFDDYEDEHPRKKRQLESMSKRPRPRSPPIAKIPKIPKVLRPKGLPVFFQPCKKLIGQMKPYIEKWATPEEVGILIKLIRAAIRKELAITLEGKAYIPTVEILNLYREKHPKEKDEAFVAKILANIRTSYLTTDTNVEKDINVKKIKKEKVSDNETDGAKGNENETIDKVIENDKDNTEHKENDKTGAKEKENYDKGDQIADNETAPKDPANGEMKTDYPAAVAVKPEPNTSPLSEEVNTETKNDDTSVPDETAGDAAKGEAAVAVKPEPNTSQELENISAGNLSEEVNTETKNDDTSVPDETAGDAAKGEDSVGDGNTEETKLQ